MTIVYIFQYPFDDPQQHREQVVVQRSSLKFGSWHLALSIWSSGFRDNRGRLNAECQMLIAVLLLLHIAVGRNPLLNQIQQTFGARSPIALRILACDLLRQRDGLTFGLV